jgi:hypothetical protein
MTTVPAHDGAQTHHYVVSFPAHPAREDDPHYADFNAFHRKYHDTAQCAIGLHRGDFSECDLTNPMELHHAHVGFALQNGVDILERRAERNGQGCAGDRRQPGWCRVSIALYWSGADTRRGE